MKPLHHASNLMSDVISNTVLDSAFAHVCKAREDKPANHDIWHLRFHWAPIKESLQDRLLQGTYQLSPLSVYSTCQGTYSSWASLDAVVLKALSIILTPVVSHFVTKHCTHLKHHGGIKGAVTKVKRCVSHYRHVIQSDVASYYHSMQPSLVLEHCKEIIKDKRVLLLIHQYVSRCEVRDGEHTIVQQGIPKGCPLSPLMGALMLKSLDRAIPADALYVRYMDDWVIAVKTKSQLRRMVRIMHRVMHRLKFKLAINKTFIGKISKGFDFLGYRFNHTGIIGIMSRSIQKFNERKAALYEQGASDQRILAYVRRWQGYFNLAC